MIAFAVTYTPDHLNKYLDQGSKLTCHPVQLNLCVRAAHQQEASSVGSQIRRLCVGDGKISSSVTAGPPHRPALVTSVASRARQTDPATERVFALEIEELTHPVRVSGSERTGAKGEAVSQ